MFHWCFCLCVCFVCFLPCILGGMGEGTTNIPVTRLPKNVQMIAILATTQIPCTAMPRAISWCSIACSDLHFPCMLGNHANPNSFPVVGRWILVREALLQRHRSMLQNGVWSHLRLLKVYPRHHRLGGRGKQCLNPGKRIFLFHIKHAWKKRFKLEYDRSTPWPGIQRSSDQALCMPRLPFWSPWPNMARRAPAPHVVQGANVRNEDKVFPFCVKATSWKYHRNHVLLCYLAKPAAPSWKAEQERCSLSNTTASWQKSGSSY